MNCNPYLLDPSSITDSSPATGIGGSWASATSIPRIHLQFNLPFSIPESQLYYWTGAWQRGESEAVRQLEAGQVMRFKDAKSAIRWLLTPDD